MYKFLTQSLSKIRRATLKPIVTDGPATLKAQGAPLISIHIPKTAGTSFKQVLELAYGNGIYEDYGTERDLEAARTPDPKIVAGRDQFAERYSIIHGHYHYLKYKALFPTANVITTLRHPIMRVVSQYRHIALHGERAVERHQLIMDGEMDLERFCKFKFIGNAQAVYLEGLDLNQLKHAIIQEYYGETVLKFCDLVGIERDNAAVQRIIEKPKNSRANSSWDSNAIPIPDGDLSYLEKYCRDDIDIYDRIVEKVVR